MKFLLFALVVALAFIGSGCGSSSTNTNANAINVAVTNSNPDNTANVVPYVPTNGTVIDANAANPANANQSEVKVVTPPTNAKPMTFPAPDNSEYSSTMNSSGQAIETRVFRNNPVINKVERIWKGVDEKTVNIYLKSGKVVKVTGDKWPDIKSQPVESFYEAAGVKPPPPVTTGTPVKKEKISDN
jgi:hypothetical protein